MKFLYKYVLKPILFFLDAEFVHDLFTMLGRMLGSFGITRKGIHILYGYHGKDISKTVDGIKYKTPVMLSAGFDYNGKLTGILESVGFGGEEVGSVTARACEGNRKPRLIRLKKSGSIVVRKGLRNGGVDAVINRIKNSHVPKGFVVGVSIARTNDEVCNTLEVGIEDYVYSLDKLVNENVGDYYAINISCPNSYCGEAYTTPEALNNLLTEIGKIKIEKPVYLKMPINLSWQEFEALLDVSLNFPYIKGYVIGNLNKNISDLKHPHEAHGKARGGLSGNPCKELSTALIKATRAKLGDSKTIIGCGGIMSVSDAIEKFEAGADLLQLITGMIFDGPHLVSDICNEISRKIVDKK